jgi:uncharacterized membrane protein
MSSLTRGGSGVAIAFAVSGTLHLVRPGLFTPLVPPALPRPRAWVVGSGLVELACAAGLARGAPWAPAAAAATLVGVWPGNWWYAVRTQRSEAHPAHKAAAWGRLPLQLPMIVSALRAYPDAGGSITAAG